LLATHDIEFVAMVADRVVVIDSGELVLDSNPLEVLGTGKELSSQIAEITGEQGLITIEQVLN
jgi:energy-coupling factor transport system ATP-binding protein